MPRASNSTATRTVGSGSVPLQGNAVVHLAAAVAAVGEVALPMRLNETTRAYFTSMAEISPGAMPRVIARMLNPTSPAAPPPTRISPKHEPGYSSMMRTSISPTMIEGGYRVNVIPSEAKATLDVRLLPDENPEQFLES